jgi:hypothetical protein
MRVFLSMLLGFVLGAVLAFAIGIGLPMIIPISQAEGAYAMGVAFFWAPLGGIIGAICGVVMARRRRP